MSNISKRTSNRLSQRSPELVIDLDTFERERRQRQREQRKSQESEELLGKRMHPTIADTTEVFHSTIDEEVYDFTKNVSDLILKEMKQHQVTSVDDTTILSNVTEYEKEKHTESKVSKFDNDNDISLSDCIRSLFEEITVKKQLYEHLFNHLNILMQVDNHVLNTIDNQDKKLSKSLHELYQEVVSHTNDLYVELFKRTSDIVTEIISRLPKNESTHNSSKYVAKDESK